MDHGGEAARPTTVESTDLSMAGAVQGDEANIGNAAFDGQLAGAPASSISDFHLREVHRNSTLFARQVRGEAPVAAGFHFYLHRQVEPGQGMAYPNIREFWRRQLGPVDVALLGLQELPADDGHGNYGYSALQPGPGAGPGMVLADDLLPDDADVANHYGYYAPQHRPATGHGEQAFVSLLPLPLPGGVDAAYNDYGYYVPQPRPGSGVAVHYPWHPRPGAGHGEVIIGQLRVVFDNSSNLVPQTLLGTGRADGIAGALRDPNLGAGYGNRDVVAEHLRRLLPLAGIGASSVAVNLLAAGPGSPAVAFYLFALLLGGLFLVILYVLRV